MDLQYTFKESVYNAGQVIDKTSSWTSLCSCIDNKILQYCGVSVRENDIVAAAEEAVKEQKHHNLWLQ
jgi:hypothetical protein